jgi:hypothetical protein
MAGFPLLAGVQGAVFYPPTWLCVVLSAGAFWTFSVLLHLIVAGVFAHRWLERGLGLGPWAALAGAVVYMLSGYIAGHLYAGHVNYVWAYPWMAALLWRLERYLAAPTLKRGVLLAVVFAMLFLAGVPQYAYFAGLLILARGLHFVLAEREGRRARAAVLGKGAAWLALGLLFCAPQLFPTLELLAQMQRGRDEDRSFITEHYLPPYKLLDIVWPPRRSTLDPFWERCGYVGAGAVVLAFVALVEKHRQRFVWLGFGLIGLLMAMGLDTPLYPGVLHILPGVGLFRGPGRYLFLFTLGMTALAAIGFHGLWNRGVPLIRIGAVVLALVSAVPLVRFTWSVIDPVVPGDWTKFDYADLVRKKIGDDGRIATTLVEDIGKCQAAGVDTVCGYEPMMLRRYAELMNVAQGYPPEKNIVIQASVGSHPVIDMLGVRGWLMLETQRRWRSRTQIVTDNPGGLPRAWLVNNAAVIESKEERLHVLAKGPWDPRKTVILEGGSARVAARSDGRVRRDGADQVPEGGGICPGGGERRRRVPVLSEAYYPGWSAKVDGKPVDVLPANHLIQAVRLRRGSTSCGLPTAPGFSAPARDRLPCGAGPRRDRTSSPTPEIVFAGASASRARAGS